MNAFSYIHVLGCDCYSSDRGSYADRLSRVRHGLVESGLNCDWEHACGLIPDGSCLAWLDRQDGWPCDRRDHHLLSRYREAVRLRGTGALDALCDALHYAPWGAQPDGAFVTQQSTGVASGRYVRTLHAPGKGGPLAVVTDHERGGGASLTALRTTVEAREIRENERRRAGEAQRVYREALRLAARRLQKGLSLRYYPGQEWGTVELAPHQRSDVRVVSARGALRAAGLTREAAEKLLSDGWEQTGIRTEIGDHHYCSRSLSLRGLEVNHVLGEQRGLVLCSP